jgi:adenine-specific DNA-methyltransferase
MSVSTPSTRKRHGQHYTPTELAEFLAKKATAHIASGKKVRVLDPACGDGELLLSAVNALRQQGCDIAELVGFDLDEEAVVQARKRLPESIISVNVNANDFINILDAPELLGHFDLVITNPPYVRTQILGSERAQQLAARFQLQGRIDLTHVFVAGVASLLAPEGVLALLCSNRFLSTKAGVNTRKILTENYTIQEVYDLGDTKLFEAAVLPAIVIAQKRQHVKIGSEARFTRVYEDRADSESNQVYPSILAALSAEVGGRVKIANKSFSIEAGVLVNDDSRNPWQLGDGHDAQWLARVMAGCWRTYGELARIRVGIKTTADSVFIRDDWSALPVHIRPESEWLLPLITHYDTEAWLVNDEPKTKVLYPYDLRVDKRKVLPLDGHPGAMAYLKSHEERLRSRRYVTDAGREWYEIWVPQRPSKWASPKIVFPDISENPQFAIERSGAVVNGDCYWICCADLPSMDIAYLMLAVANSSLGARFYDSVCGNRLYSGKRRWITQYVEKLPLPNPASPPARKAVEIAQQLTEPSTTLDRRRGLQSELDALVEEAFLDSDGEDMLGKPDLQLSILDVPFETLEF